MDRETIYFKNWLDGLENERFYYFVRNFLPEVSTPFIQSDVSEQLISFFLNEEKAQTMLSTIDEIDSILLGIINLTKQASTSDILKLLKPFGKTTPTEDKKFKFHSYFEKNDFIDEFNYVKIIDHISSLVKRLIILSENGKFILNPIFKDKLVSKCSLLPFCKTKEEESIENIKSDYITTEFLRGYLSIIKNDHNLSLNQKKNILTPLFPSYTQTEIIEVTDEIDKLLLNLNIFKPFDFIEYQLLQKLIDLSDFALNTLLIANNIGDVFDAKSNYIDFAKDLLTIIIKLKQFSSTTLNFFIEALAMKYNIKEVKHFNNNLMKLMVIEKVGTQYISKNIALGKEESQILVFDTDLSVRYLGKRGKEDFLWRFAQLSSLDTQTTYKLTKEDFRDAMDSKLSPQKIYDYIKQNSFTRENCPALKHLELIERQYTQVAIYDGIIIQGNERVSKIISSHPDLESHIIKQLSENIFLMRRDSEQKWTSIIENTGLLVPRRKGDLIQSDTFFTNEQWRTSKGYHLIEEQKSLLNLVEHCCSDNFLSTVSLTDLPTKKDFISKQLKIAIELLDCRKDEKDDLKARLADCLIIDKSQLSSPKVLDTHIQASGFEFRRKVNVFKMATKESNTILKIGYQSHEFLIIVDKVKSAGSNEYYISAKSLPNLEEVEIPVSKIFYVKITNYIIE